MGVGPDLDHPSQHRPGREPASPAVQPAAPGDPLPDPVDPSGSWPAPVGLTGVSRPVLAERQCSRTGCSERAEATLTYHYGQSQVWLDDLAIEREPHTYDICGRHAGTLSVPHGWHLDDRRFRRGLIAV